MIKKFFNISGGYEFEWGDLNTLLTLLNVILIICGWHFAPIIGIVNCAINLVIDVLHREHLNFYTTHLAILVLNIYFLM